LLCVAARQLSHTKDLCESTTGQTSSVVSASSKHASRDLDNGLQGVEEETKYQSRTVDS
jgi:hypothetical protein